MKKHISEFKEGDLVSAHGGIFFIIENAYSAPYDQPEYDHLERGYGPSDCAIAKSVCVQGESVGYFKRGTEWNFQGNLLAGQYHILN